MKRILSYLAVVIMAGILFLPVSVYAAESSSALHKANGEKAIDQNWGIGSEQKIKNLEQGSKMDLKSNDGSMEIKGKDNDTILPDEKLVKAVYNKGGKIVLPFNLKCFGNAHKYYVDIYNSSGVVVASASGKFPNWVGITKLSLTWDTSGEKLGKYYVNCYATVKSEGDDYIWPFYLKGTQKITASNITKAYGDSAYTPSIKTSGNGTLTYKSSNTKVATISSEGKLTIKGIGTTKLTVTASATSKYKSATKSITVTVNPAKMKLSKVTTPKKAQMKVIWEKDSKASGYQIQYAANSKFTSGKVTETINKNATTSKTFSKLKSNKTYYARVRAYKVVGGKKMYGYYSTPMKVKVK